MIELCFAFIGLIFGFSLGMSSIRSDVEEGKILYIKGLPYKAFQVSFPNFKIEVTEVEEDKNDNK